MADFCGPCARLDLDGASDFLGWLAGSAGYCWGHCGACGTHLFDDAGEAACAGEGGPLHAVGACLACVERAQEVTVVPPTIPAQLGATSRELAA